MPSLMFISSVCLLASSALAAPSAPATTDAPEFAQLEPRIPSGRGPRIYPIPIPQPNPFTRSACPTCVPATTTVPASCAPTQPVVNPGFEFSGGTYNFWTSNDTSVTNVVGTYFQPDVTNAGSHSLQYTLSGTRLGGMLSQTIPVCPNRLYNFKMGIYYDSSVTTAIAAICNLNIQIGTTTTSFSFANTTFIGIPPTLGLFVDVTFPYTSPGTTAVGLAVGVQCASLSTTVNFYIDNVKLNPALI